MTRAHNTTPIQTLLSTSTVIELGQHIENIAMLLRDWEEGQGDGQASMEDSAIWDQMATLGDTDRDGPQAHRWKDGEFYGYTFSNQECGKFQAYLQVQIKESLALETAQSDTTSQKSDIKRPKAKKVRYIQKIRSPKTVFNCYGIDIEVVFQPYKSHSGSCLILPYDSFTTQGLSKLNLSRSLILSILQQYDDKTVTEMEQNAEVIPFWCRRNTNGENYSWIYLVRKPYYKYMPQYSSQKLHEMVQATLAKCCRYSSTKNIVFPDFEWLGLQALQKCQIFYYALINNLYKEQSQKRIGLRTITICCEKQSSYFEFANKLREISDLYVRSGLIDGPEVYDY